MSKQERRWEVWDQATLVLELSDTAGSVTGPGRGSVSSPVLSARVLSGAHEPRLRALIEAATSVPELVARLQNEGYRVRLTTPVRRWNVYEGKELILELSDVPGPIVDVTAALPPGARPVFNPFLSASSHSPWHGDRLHRLLDESTSVEDFLERLRSAHYRVEPVKE